MLRSPFVDAADALNKPPFMLLNEWSELPTAYAPFSGDSELALSRLDAMQNEVIAWWSGFKKFQQLKVRSAIDAVMAA